MLWYSCFLDAQRVARTGFVVVIVPKVSVGAVNALALLLAGNVILMFVEIVGSGALLVMLLFFCCFLVPGSCEFITTC